MNIIIDYEWLEVEVSPGVRYRFPNERGRHLRSCYSGPHVYRWVIEPTREEQQKLYVGEAENLYRRLGGYLKPGPSQATNLRLREYLSEVVASGRAVKLEVLNLKQLLVGQHGIDQQMFGDKDVRRFVEGLLILHYRLAGETLLNK